MSEHKRLSSLDTNRKGIQKLDSKKEIMSNISQSSKQRVVYYRNIGTPSSLYLLGRWSQETTYRQKPAVNTSVLKHFPTILY